MRIAIVSDIHGNRTALEAVVADLRQLSPDLVLHGGDLADTGSSPVEVIDLIRDLGWPGVAGNTDELLFRPEALSEFASGSPALLPLWTMIEEMAAATRERLGPERLAWLGALPRILIRDELALVHATADSLWQVPAHTASDAELYSAYAPLAQPLVVYGHIHHPDIREMPQLTVANSGSAGLPYDGDSRAACLIVDGGKLTIRRVEYDLDRELNALSGARVPHAGWVARTLRSGRPEMP